MSYRGLLLPWLLLALGCPAKMDDTETMTGDTGDTADAADAAASDSEVPDLGYCAEP